MRYHDKLTMWMILGLVATVCLGQLGCAAPTPVPTLSPAAATSAPTAMLSATPIPPTTTATATALPTDTPRPTASATRTCTATPLPSATPWPTTTLAPSATATLAQPTAAQPAATQPPASNASAGEVAAKPKGSPLTYALEFPPVGPASAPPSVNGGTNPLTGQPVADPGLVQRRALLVRYGNDRAARPHAGISQADVVFEELMDAWWITRLTAVFLQNEPDKVGPIRSARPVLLEVLPATDGALVYSGASIGVTQLLADGGYNLIDETRDGDIFFRGTDRKSPHNLYTSIPAARQRLRERGWERASALRGWTFAADAPAGASAASVDIPYPPTSVVRWTYDAAAGVYRRWVQGAAYVDQLSGVQVGSENVVVLYAKHWETDIVEDSRGATAIGIALKGGGRVQVIRDGRVIEGYWWRAEPDMLFQFIDSNGNHIPLKPGHTWVQLVPTSYQLDIR